MKLKLIAALLLGLCVAETVPATAEAAPTAPTVTEVRGTEVAIGRRRRRRGRRALILIGQAAPAVKAVA